jgi:septal ring factor EnvC (AmiA/AmiB activator)
MTYDFAQVIAQRNRAVACAVLSISLSLALVMSNFRSYRKDLVEAHQQILQLQDVLISTQKALKANEEGILQLQKALAERVHAGDAVAQPTPK